mgnify:CR=1 FL=1
MAESTLDGLDLIGGIIGGLVAQELLRHKTAKDGFVLVTVLIGLLHLALLVGLLAGVIGPEALPDMLR